MYPSHFNLLGPSRAPLASRAPRTPLNGPSSPSSSPVGVQQANSLPVRALSARAAPTFHLALRRHGLRCLQSPSAACRRPALASPRAPGQRLRGAFSRDAGGCQRRRGPRAVHRSRAGPVRERGRRLLRRPAGRTRAPRPDRGLPRQGAAGPVRALLEPRDGLGGRRRRAVHVPHRALQRRRRARQPQRLPRARGALRRGLRAIPELVGQLWSSNAHEQLAENQSGGFGSELELFDAAVERLEDFGSREMDAHARLLALACAQVRVAAGSDAAYAWLARECATWGAHSFSIRQLDMASVPTSQLLLHRYREGATTLTIVHMLVALGLRISPELVELLTEREQQRDMEGDTSLLVSAGLHICLVNDILSYDRDQGEAGFLQNFVEYQRRHGEAAGSFDAAVSATVEHCNALVRAMKKDVETLAARQGLKCIARGAADSDRSNDADTLRVVLKTVARSVLGNIRWSAECARYSRVELIMGLVSAP